MTMKGQASFTAALLLFGLAVAGCDGEQSQPPATTDTLQVESGWYRPPVPGRAMTAAYATLRNSSDQALVLASFDSPHCDGVELHNHIHEQGVMKMRRVEEYELAAGEVLVMQPGGHHLMLYGIDPQVAASGSIELSVQLDNGERAVFTATARSH